MGYKRRWLFVVLSVWLVGCTQTPAKPVPPQADQKWYHVRISQASIKGDPLEKLIGPEDAVRLFEEQYPAKWGQWERFAEDPRLVRGEAKREIPRAILTEFCDTHVKVEIHRALPHDPVTKGDPRERTDRIVIPRTTDIDAIFDVPTASTKFNFRYKNIGQGSSCPWGREPAESKDDVTRAFGKPDGTYGGHQLGGSVEYYFGKDNVSVFCSWDKVYYVSLGKPEWVKRQEREGVIPALENSAGLDRGAKEEDQ